MICLIQAPGYCMTENSIEHFLWNPSEFTSNVVFENLCCLWIVFINSTFQVPPTENSQSSWDHTVARGYRFEVKCIYPLGSTAWGTQEFCLCNELAPHLAGIPQCSYQCLFFFFSAGTTFLCIISMYHSASKITRFPSLSSKKYSLKIPSLPVTPYCNFLLN